MYDNSFSRTSKTLGFIGLFCSFFSLFWFSFLFGALAIILAILSKGSESHMCKSAKRGMISGLSALVIQGSILAVSFYNILYVPEYQEQFKTTFYQMYEQMYGIPFEDSYPEFLDDLGISL